MATTERRDILDHEYVKIYTSGFGDIVLLFENEKEKPLAVGQKMNEINEEAYMNGYNWDALFNCHLEEVAPDILESMESDPEAGSYAAYFKETRENEQKAKRFADIIISLIENEDETYHRRTSLSRFGPPQAPRRSPSCKRHISHSPDPESAPHEATCGRPLPAGFCGKAVFRDF